MAISCNVSTSTRCGANETPLAWDANQASIVAAISQARQRGVSVLRLPELCISGDGWGEDAFLSLGVQRHLLRVLQEMPRRKE